MLYSYWQMRRDYKIKFTDNSKANLWIYLDLAKVHRLKGLTSPYIISYLHFLNIDNILILVQTLVFAEAGFGLTWMMFALVFACQIYTHACWFMKSKQMQAVYGGVENEIKWKNKSFLSFSQFLRRSNIQ